jgi:fumarate hydratase class I
MTKKVAAKKVAKKVSPKKIVKVVKKLDAKQQTMESIIELIRRTSTEVPDDVFRTIVAAAKNEEANTTADYAMGIIKQNIDLAKFK